MSLQPTTFIIEDDPIITLYLNEILFQYGIVSITLFDNATSVLKHLESINATIPQLILCDVHLNDTMTGVDLCRILTEKYSCKVIFITGSTSEEFIVEAAKMNAIYLVKPVQQSQVKVAIQMVMSQLNAESKTPSNPPVLNLTRRELQIVELIEKGMNSKQIADSLFISLETIHTHRKNILSKNKVNNFSELIYLLNP